MNKIIGYIKAFCQLRFLYTIWFNYKYLPVKQAQKLPFRFYKAAYASISKGSKIIVDDDYIKNGGRIHIGLHTLDFEYQCEKTHLNIYNGILVIHGLLDLRRGCIFDIKGSAEFGNDIVFALDAEFASIILLQSGHMLESLTKLKFSILISTIWKI